MASTYSTKLPDMSRRTDLAGRTVSSNGMNVTYDSDGYAVSGINYNHPVFAGTDRGVAAPSVDRYNDTGGVRGGYGGSSYDQQYMSTRDLQNAAFVRQQAQNGLMSWADANAAVEGIRARYGYAGGGNGAGYTKLGTIAFDPDDVTTQPLYQQLLARQNGGYAPNAYANSLAAQYQMQLAAQQSQYQRQYRTLQQQYNDLTEYIRQQQQAKLESELSNLKSAYETSMNGYNAELARLPQAYEAARNSTATQDALARRAFDERAIAAGLSSGTAGQAELSRSAALQSALSQIDRQQANAIADINLQTANLATQYQNAIAEAKANNDATRAQALYEEMVRQQSIAREDAQIAAQLEQSKASTTYQQLLQLAQLGANIGDYGGYKSLANRLGVDTSDFEEQQAALTARQANAYKPTFTVAQVRDEVKNAEKSGTTLSANVLRDYEYYYGVPYSGAGTLTGTSSIGSTGTGGRGSKISYNNGSLTSAQIKEIQGALGVTQDGYFGHASQAAAKSKYGTTSADAAWAKYRAAGTASSTTTGGAYGGSYVANSAAIYLWELRNDKKGGATDATLANKIQQWMRDGKITNAQADYLLSYFGY